MCGMSIWRVVPETGKFMECVAYLFISDVLNHIKKVLLLYQAAKQHLICWMSSRFLAYIRKDRLKVTSIWVYVITPKATIQFSSNFAWMQSHRRPLRCHAKFWVRKDTTAFNLGSSNFVGSDKPHTMNYIRHVKFGIYSVCVTNRILAE
jgi:hypothetical protein